MKVTTHFLTRGVAAIGITALTAMTVQVPQVRAAVFTSSTFNTDFNGNFTPTVGGANNPNTGAKQSSGITTNVPGWTNNSGYNFIVPFSTTVAPINQNLNQLSTTGGPYFGADAGLRLYGNTPLVAPTGTGATWFIAADGAFGNNSFSQVISGLTVNTTYDVSYWYAAGQQQGFTGATTDAWAVGFGSSALLPGPATDPSLPEDRTPLTPAPTTNAVATASQPEYHTSAVISQASAAPVSGWQQDTASFKATSGTETLSFLAQGTPAGKPPFALLTGVTFKARSSTPLPEPLDYLGTLFGGAAVFMLRKKLIAAKK